LDIGALKNSLVGESERRMRQATQVIDAFGECLVWCDEIEKSLAGSKSSGETDAGTTAAMLGHLLLWLQETRSPVLVMATANNISQLPPEFLRAGRFDSIFFVDLPAQSERVEIIRIMNRKYHTNIPDDYAEKLQGYTGSEIEQIAKDSLFDGLEPAMESVIPLSKTMREETNVLRDWAKNRARFANASQDEAMAQRKVHVARS
jgi:SpoVK/Ycf46/Vps4 family AAA+-type ATPase